jgi:recombination protein RecT
MTTALTPVTEIKNSLAKMADNFKSALPAHIPAERFIAVAQTALVNAPALANLERNSLYQAFIQSAQDGLLPDGREAAIVPFGGKARYMPMVAGICKKARNSGEIGTIDSQVVYEKDTYEAWVDEKGPHFKHVRARGDRGEIVLTYAYALGKDGSVYFEEVSEEQMKKIQAMSKANDSPWKGPFADEMRRKSALRRLGKYRLPNSTDLVSVLEKDDEIYETEATEVPNEAPKQTFSRLGKIVAAQAPLPVTIQAIQADQASAEPAADTVITADDAAQMARDVFSEPAPKPVTKTAVKAKPATGAPSVTGKIEDLTAKDGVGANGPWRRHAVKVNGEYYGTFDTKINDQLVEALDAGQAVKIEYIEKVSNGKSLKNIVSVSAVVEAEVIDEADLPI